MCEKLSDYNQSCGDCHGHVREWIRVLMDRKAKGNNFIQTMVAKDTPCTKGFNEPNVKRIEQEEDFIEKCLPYSDNNNNLFADRQTKQGRLNNLAAIAVKHQFAVRAANNSGKFSCLHTSHNWAENGIQNPTVPIQSAIKIGKERGGVAVELAIQGDGGAHSLGVVYQPNSADGYEIGFFDPNYGEWRCRKVADFLRWISVHLNTKYSDQLDLVYCHYFVAR